MSKDGQTTLAKYVGVIFLILVLLGIVGVLTGCEEPKIIPLPHPQPTTRPMLATQPSPIDDITSPIYIVTIQKDRLDRVLASYLIESRDLAKARISLLQEQVLADVIYQQARRKGTEKRIEEADDFRKKLEEESAKLDALAFELLSKLTSARMDMARFERENPGWYLMVIK